MMANKKCKVKSCSKERYGRKKYCRVHHGRLKRYGNVYTDVPIGLHGSRGSLAMQRKQLQAKPGYKYCQHCDEHKKIEKFGKGCQQCKNCRRNWVLKKNHGIDNETYNKLLKKQKGKCALCGTKDPKGRRDIFQIDHNHQTDKIRGLLCTNCNLGIGMLEFNKVSIVHLIKYLRPSKTELRRIIRKTEKQLVA